MAKVPTGIPKSLVAALRNFFSGSALDVLWKLFISVMLLLFALFLASLSFLGAFIAGIILGALISDDVRRFVSDLWHRRFHEIKIPFL